MFCPECGKKSGGRAKYCSYCGHPVPMGEEMITPKRMSVKAHPKKPEDWAKWIAVSGVVILFITVMLFLAVPKANQMRYESLVKDGNRYLAEMKYVEAVVAFTKAIRVEDKESDPYIGRGNAYVSLASQIGTEDGMLLCYQLAEGDYMAALELDEALTDIYIALSELYLVQDNLEKAGEILEDGYQITESEELAKCLNEIQARIEEGSDGDFVVNGDIDPDSLNVNETDETIMDSNELALTAAYENVLNQYRALCAIPDDGSVDFLINDSLYEIEYPDVNPRMVFYYHAYHDREFYYTCYDVDQDGQDELIMGFGSPEEMAFIDVLIYDDSSKKIISLNNDSRCVPASLGDRSHLKFCTDGTLIIISSSSGFNVNYTFLSLENGEFHKANEYDQDTRERPDRSFFDGTSYLTETRMNAILNEYTYIPEDSFQWIPLMEGSSEGDDT